MWDLPRSGLEPVSPALAGRFSTTAPPGKPSLLTSYSTEPFLRDVCVFIYFFTPNLKHGARQKQMLRNVELSCSLQLTKSFKRNFLSLSVFFFLIFIYLFRLHWVLVAACGLLSCGMHAGSSSPTRDWTWPFCIGSTESYPLDHQGIPFVTLFEVTLRSSKLCYDWNFRGCWPSSITDLKQCSDLILGRN